MHLISKEVLKGNKLKGKFYLLSSRMVDCKFCYASLQNERHAIDQKYACLHNSYTWLHAAKG